MNTRAMLLLPMISCSIVAAPILAPTASTERSEGERLYIELSCAGCHPGGETGFPRRKGPVLGKDGMKLTPQFVTSFLTDPQTEKPGTTMPNIMHGVPEKPVAAAVEALTQFLLRNQQGEAKPIPAETRGLEQGRELYDRSACADCHTTVPVGNLAKKTTLSSLAEFLFEPAKFRPAVHESAAKLPENDAATLAYYLLRDQVPEPGPDGPRPMAPLDPIQFNLDESLADRGEQLFNSMNCSACHDIADTPAYVLNSKPLRDLSPTQGCLAEDVPIGIPDFQLTPAQRLSIAKHIEQLRLPPNSIPNLPSNSKE